MNRPNNQRDLWPDRSEAIANTAADLEATFQALLFWQAAAQAAKSPLALRDLTEQAERMAARREQLERELAELQATPWDRCAEKLERSRI